jgi:hypothetical protein
MAIITNPINRIKGVFINYYNSAPARVAKSIARDVVNKSGLYPARWGAMGTVGASAAIGGGLGAGYGAYKGDTTGGAIRGAGLGLAGGLGYRGAAGIRGSFRTGAIRRWNQSMYAARMTSNLSKARPLQLAAGNPYAMGASSTAWAGQMGSLGAIR